MQKWLVSCIVLVSCFGTRSSAQDEASIKRYIDQYKLLAIAEQKRSSVPASITLAQGIHETMAGKSELATMANNHFGIKCKKEWTGETFAHTDDAPNECFRKYSHAEESYLDHSNYLAKTPRYAGLFRLSVTDYAGWAFGLKQAGYATNPKYAHVLIKLIEDYHLQEFTYAAMGNDLGSKYAIATEVVPEQDANTQNKTVTKNVNDDGTPVIATLETHQVASAPTELVVVEPAPPVPATTEPAQSLDGVTVRKNIVVTEDDGAKNTTEVVPAMPPYGQPVKINGLKAVYAKKGDMPLEYAIRNNLRYERLLEINEIDERPLPMDMFLYLERKNFRGVRATHKVKGGETMFQVAQAEGIQLKNLFSLNNMQPGEEPEPGTILELQRQATSRPSLARKEAQQPVNMPVPEPVVAAETSAPAQSLPVTQTVETTEPATTTALNNTPVETTPPVIETKNIPTPPVEAAPVITENITPTTPEPATVTPPPVEQPVANVDAPVKTEVMSPQPDIIIAKAEPTPPIEQPLKEPIAETTPATPAVIGPPSSPNDIPAKPVETPKPVTTTPAPPPVAVEPPTPEEPKTELDLLKSKFDKVVYAKPKPAETTTPKEEAKSEEPKPAPKEAVAASTTPKFHIVKKGETAFGIAKANNLTMKQLMDLNNMDFAEIKTGQKLRVQ